MKTLYVLHLHATVQLLSSMNEVGLETYGIAFE